MLILIMAMIAMTALQGWAEEEEPEEHTGDHNLSIAYDADWPDNSEKNYWDVRWGYDENSAFDRGSIRVYADNIGTCSNTTPYIFAYAEAYGTFTTESGGGIATLGAPDDAVMTSPALRTSDPNDEFIFYVTLTHNSTFGEGEVLESQSIYVPEPTADLFAIIDFRAVDSALLGRVIFKFQYLTHSPNNINSRFDLWRTEYDGNMQVTQASHPIDIGEDLSPQRSIYGSTRDVTALSNPNTEQITYEVHWQNIDTETVYAVTQIGPFSVEAEEE